MRFENTAGLVKLATSKISSSRSRFKESNLFQYPYCRHGRVYTAKTVSFLRLPMLVPAPQAAAASAAISLQRFVPEFHTISSKPFFRNARSETSCDQTASAIVSVGNRGCLNVATAFPIILATALGSTAPTATCLFILLQCSIIGYETHATAWKMVLRQMVDKFSGERPRH